MDKEKLDVIEKILSLSESAKTDVFKFELIQLILIAEKNFLDYLEILIAEFNK